MTTTKRYDIAVLPGDGIGPEVIASGLEILHAVGDTFGISFDCTTYEAGAGLYRKSGVSISDEDMKAIGTADAMLLGAMGHPDTRKPDGTEVAPQIDIREHYGLFASLRPAKLFPGVPTNVRSEFIDMLVIRETTEGLFAGRHDKAAPSDEAVSDRLTITRATSEKLFNLAFAQAAARKESHGSPGRVTLFDKSNVLRSNAFMRKVFDEVAAAHPDIEAQRLYIDAGSMMLVTNPERFDVIVTENVFGDIVSEIAAGVVGGLGVAPSGDVSADHGVFQPCHGTAPDIAGAGLANPVATILSVAMMLDWLGVRNGDERSIAAAKAVRNATADALNRGLSTPDIGGTLSTSELSGTISGTLRSATVAA
ncbi:MULTISPECIES: isocitrate/isopropylmalate dehydrogenase family protein [unclassified Pseudarthrobacter]|uniref:isocitrate/isopropylmalate dehydrogenase family protein n=1 Tax=unclassified Pseudarthrobacter TaxID=2647000 RepID=UPI0030785477